MDIYLVQCKRANGWQDYAEATHLQAVNMAKDHEARRVRGFHWRCVHRCDTVIWGDDTNG